MCNLYREHSTHVAASYQVLVYLSTVVSEKISKNQPIKKQELPVAAMHVYHRIGTKCAIFIEDLP
jgi:hypothetical protein